MTAFGIFFMIRFCPTPSFDPVMMVAEHWLVVLSAMGLGALLGRCPHDAIVHHAGVDPCALHRRADHVAAHGRRLGVVETAAK